MKLQVLGLVLCVLAGARVWATQPGFCKIDAALSVEVPKSIELNVPFDVTFFFETLEPLHVDPMKPHTARLHWPENAVLLSGDTVWMGVLSPGVTVSLQATFKIVEPRWTRFNGSLVTMGGTAPVLDVKDPTHGYLEHRNSAGSRLILFGNERSPKGLPVLVVTDTGLVIDTSRASGFAPSVELPGAIAEIPPKTKAPRRDARTADDSTSNVYVKLSGTGADTVITFYYPGSTYAFVGDSVLQDVELLPIAGSVTFDRIGSNLYRLKLDSRTATFKAVADSIETVVIIYMPNFYLIEGQVTYADGNGYGETSNDWHDELLDPDSLLSLYEPHSCLLENLPRMASNKRITLLTTDSNKVTGRLLSVDYNRSLLTVQKLYDADRAGSQYRFAQLSSVSFRTAGKPRPFWMVTGLIAGLAAGIWWDELEGHPSDHFAKKYDYPWQPVVLGAGGLFFGTILPLVLSSKNVECPM